MTYETVLEKSREVMGPYCKSCPICNGRACSNKIPGPGAKGLGDTAIRNYDAWQKIYLNMDTITDNVEVDTSLKIFDKKFKYPIFAGPVGAVGLHYGDLYDDEQYNNVLIEGCKEAGIVAFGGDGKDPKIMQDIARAIKNNGGMGIPTIKPWSKEVYMEKLQHAIDSNTFAIAMDIDAAGLPFLKGSIPLAGRKNVAELKEIIEKTPVPFIVKGIMTVKGALKAKEAKASAIVVSNHGGRVLDGCPATADVLEEIVAAVGNDMKIFVDGGIRSGTDVFKALALGADGVLIARPFVNAVYGAGKEGIQILVDKLGNELRDAMEMCGASSLKDITRDMIYKAG